MEVRLRNDRRTATGQFARGCASKPEDFAATFIRIGRIGCETHYRVGRLTIDAWLEECGKAAMIDLRASFVRQRQAERRELERLSRKDVGNLLREAFREPLPGKPIPESLSREAAQWLRIRRNGGFFVSQSPNGDWIVGTRRMAASDMVSMARGKGFRPAITRWPKGKA